MRELLSIKDLASHLGRSEATLARWRMEGKGPRFVRMGQFVRYDTADVEAWLEQQKTGGEAA